MIPSLAKLYRCSLVLIGLLLSGCVSSIDYQKQLASTPSCCERLEELQYLPLAYNRALRLNLGGKKSPARWFASGKSFFAAVRLPNYISPYEVQIISQPKNKQLLWPVVQLLDQNFQVLKELEANKFIYSNGELKTTFFVNQDLAYSYMLFYTKPSLIGKSGTVRTVESSGMYIPLSSGGVNLTQGADSIQQLKTAAGGVLSVKLIQYQPRKIK